jgi:S-methylmethionine-dependent homocysteine/selenocysteine methylase
MTTIINTSNGQRKEPLFLTDGGLETTLVFHKGIDLPEFAAFVLLENEQGTEVLRNYYRSYLDIAVRAKLGFVLESPTWRANRDWGERLGYDRDALANANRRSIALLRDLRDEYAALDIPLVISGIIGPRGDGYVTGERMTSDEATEYHDEQIGVLANAGAERITAMTLTYPEEAIGIVRAAKRHDLPSVIGFTTETDGYLPCGDSLQRAILTTDAAETGCPEYYMINCAHTDHFSGALHEGAEWANRIRSVRANASRQSHAELDESERLDDGDPQEFASLHRQLLERFPQVNVVGGCCGTDQRHIQALSMAIA